MATLDRRRFLTALLGTAALGSSPLLARKLAQLPKPAAWEIGGLEIGVQSFTFRSFSLERMIAAMTSLGLASVELWTGHLDPLRHGKREFRAASRRFDEAGIRVSAYCVNFPPDASDRLLDRAFRGARLLGTNQMTTSTEKALVPRLERWCREHCITLGLHNHWLGDAWFHGDKQQNFESPEDFLGAVEGRSRRIALNLDVGHFYAAGHDPVAFFRQHHERINSLHLKDRDADSTHTHRRFGEGATPLAEILRLAREVGFRRAVNIEYEGEEQDPTDGVRAALAYVRGVLG